LAGKVALVTGIGAGIGRGCALIFAGEGAGTDIGGMLAHCAGEGAVLAMTRQLAVEGGMEE